MMSPCGDTPCHSQAVGLLRPWSTLEYQRQLFGGVPSMKYSYGSTTCVSSEKFGKTSPERATNSPSKRIFCSSLSIPTAYFAKVSTLALRYGFFAADKVKQPGFTGFVGSETPGSQR